MTASRPVVSVVMCTRNGADFVEEQLLSILRSDVVPDEVVILDDASDDSTPTIVSHAASAGKGVAFSIGRNKEPLGVTANFEAAIARATGDIIFLADQDDVWAPNRIARSLEEFDEHPTTMLVHSDATIIDARGEALGGTLFQRLEVDDADVSRINAGSAFGLYLRRNLATGATVAFRRELLDLALPFPREWFHDEWLTILAASRESVRIVDEPLIRYRLHGTNQVGAAEPSFRAKLRRVFEPGRSRLEGLVRRTAILGERLESTGASETAVALTGRKLRVEGARAALPRSRARRLPAVLKLLFAGEYVVTSQGRREVLRDLFRRGEDED